MVRSAARLARISAVGVILVLVASAPYVAFAQSGDQPTAVQLQTEIQVAVSARTYSSGLLSTAASHGLNISSAQSLIVTGNSSLASARSELAFGGNLTAGVHDALTAISDFSAASVSLGIALQESGLAGPADFESAIGAITSANGTTAVLSTIITNVCAMTSVNSSLTGGFLHDCNAGRTDVSNSFVALKEASIAVAEAEAGQAGANLSTSSVFVAQARSNLTQAAALIGQLSAYTYAERGEAFVSGPLAHQMALANASVGVQGSLSAEFGTLVSDFQSSSSAIGTGVDGVTSTVSVTSSAISSVDYASVGTSASTQEATLANIQSDLALLGQQLPAALPPGITATIQSDITATQANLTIYSKALENSGSVADSYPSVILSGFSAYSASYQAGVMATEQEAQAFLASYSSLQTEVNDVASQFPLLTILAQWSVTLDSAGQGAAAGSVAVDTALQGMSSALTSLGTDISDSTVAVESATTKVQVGSALIQNATAISSSEVGWLNSTGMTLVVQAVASLKTTAQAASNFTASSQALMQLQLDQIGPAAQNLASMGASVKSQTAAASGSMSSAEVVIAGDLQARVQAVASANSLIHQALSLLGALQVSQGVSLLVQASAQVQLAYSKPD